MRDVWAVPARAPPEGHTDKPKCIRSQGQELMHLERTGTYGDGWRGIQTAGSEVAPLSVEFDWPDTEKRLLGEPCSALPSQAWNRALAAAEMPRL